MTGCVTHLDVLGQGVGWGLAAFGAGIGVAGWKIGNGLAMFGNLTIRRER